MENAYIAFTHASSALAKSYSYQTKAFTIGSDALLTIKNQESQLLAKALGVAYINISSKTSEQLISQVEKTNNERCPHTYDNHFSWDTSLAHCTQTSLYSEIYSLSKAHQQY